MANNNETTTKFKVDISELKSAMQEAKRQVALANSEFKAVSSSMDNWSKSTDGIKAKLTQLNSNLNSQKRVLSEYEKTLEEVKAEYGENSKEAQEWQTKLNNQKAVVNKTEQEIKKFESSLSRVAEAEEIASQTGRDVNDVLDEMERATQEAEGGVENLSDGFTVMKGALASLVADGIRMAISALKDMAGAVVEVGSSFSSSMAEVQAISGASADELEQLEKTAREFGATTVFSASESADALKYMALAGWDVEQSTSALGGVLDLASASGMGLAEASDMVTDYLSAFSMTADKSSYFADMLAYAQGNANTSAEQLGEAYKNTASVMNAGGQDIETTTALLSMMANQGLKGSEAGTALTAVMRDMTAKMKDGKIAIGKTNIEVMDANGNYRDLTDILKDVEKATQGMGDAEKATALMTTFTADSTKGLNLLLNAGIGEAEAFEEALRGAGGTAGEMSAIMNDNLAGDVKAFQSALEELALKVYDALEPALRDIIAFVQDLANQFNEWLADPATKEAIDELGAQLTEFVQVTLTNIMDFIKWFIENKDTVIAGIAGIGTALAVMNVANMIMGLVKAFQAFKVAQEGATVAQWLLNVAMSANPIGIVIALIAGLVAGFIVLWNTSDEFRQFWIDLWENIKATASTVADWLVNLFTVTIPEAFQNIVNWFSEIPTKVSEFVESVKTKFTEWRDHMIETIVKFFSELPNKIAYALGYALGTIIKWGADTWTFVTVKVPEIIQAIVKFFSELPSKIWAWLLKTIDNVSSWASDMKTKATEAGTQFVTNLINFIKELPSKVWTWLNNVITKVTTFVKNMKTKATEAGKGFFDNLVDAVKDLPNKFMEIGSNIVSGIWDGISSGWEWLTSKVSDLAGSLLQGAQDALDIHSPSRAFRDLVGKQIPAGIALGIDDNAKTALNSVKNLALDMVSATRSGLTTTGGASGGVVNNFTQVINSPKQLSRLDIYRQSKNLLGYAGGGY